MHIEIKVETERRIRDHIDAGRYESAEQVVDDAVRQFTTPDDPAGEAGAPRTGGQSQGQVKIADDFDTLHADLQEAFGVGGR